MYGYSIVSVSAHHWSQVAISSCEFSYLFNDHPSPWINPINQRNQGLESDRYNCSYSSSGDFFFSFFFTVLF